MIEVFISSTEKFGFVWNADDWLKLRQNYRIVGDLIGSLSKYPRQNSFNGLPVCLQPEEVTLLKEKEYVKLIYSPSLTSRPQDVQSAFEEKEKEFQELQRKEYLLKKKNDVERSYSHILAGKSRKNKLFCANSDRKSLISEEVNKIQSISSSNILTCTPIADPWLSNEHKLEPNWSFPSTEKEKLKYKIFKDLWEKNYFITSGIKFGGDFLCYAGDPSKFHAQYIIVVKESEVELPIKELVMFGRIGSSTKKTVALATEIEGNISYQSLQWIENC